MDVSLVPTTYPRDMPMNGAALSTNTVSIGNAVYKHANNCCWQVVATGSGDATIQLEFSLDGINWSTAATSSSNPITLTAPSNKFIYDLYAGTPAHFVRMNVTANSGAVVTCKMSG